MTHLDLHLYTFTSISQLKCISEIHNIQKNLTMATECCVCMEQFELDGDKCPKLLPCTHTLCLQCLQQLCNERPCIQCPECCAFHQVPNRNAKKFQTNRYMLEILEGKEKIAHLEETVKKSTEFRGDHNGVNIKQ